MQLIGAEQGEGCFIYGHCPCVHVSMVSDLRGASQQQDGNKLPDAFTAPLPACQGAWGTSVNYNSDHDCLSGVCFVLAMENQIEEHFVYD